jgi:hypothetical protein
VAHVHGNNHGGTIFSGGFALKYPAFMNIMQRDNGDEMMGLRISHSALLWHLICSACKCGCGQVRRTCGHVSTAFVVHSEHVMVGYLSGQNRCLRALLIY